MAEVNTVFPGTAQMPGEEASIPKDVVDIADKGGSIKSNFTGDVIINSKWADHLLEKGLSSP